MCCYGARARSSRGADRRSYCLRSRCPAPPGLATHRAELLFHRSSSLRLAEPGLARPAAARTRTYVADLEGVQVSVIRALLVQPNATCETAFSAMRSESRWR